jgi:hypothetical protein
MLGALRVITRSAPSLKCATGSSATYSCFPSSGARHLGLYINLEDDDEEEDDAGPSQWRSDDDGQGCSTWAAKDEPPSDNNDSDGAEDYDVFYHHLSMN